MRQTGLEAARGHRVFGTGGAVDAVTLIWDGRELRARRRAAGWQVDGRDADRATAGALDDLVEMLAGLRAIDAFRARDAGSYGLGTPQGTIELRGGTSARRLVVGGINAAGSAYYARRDGDARVLQVGIGLGSSIERVFYVRDRQRPEIG